MNLSLKILKNLKQGFDVYMIAPTHTGKSYFVNNYFIPFCEQKNIEIGYFADCDYIKISKKFNFYVVDEVEVMIDYGLLQIAYLDSEPYPYSSHNYLTKVKNWYKKLGTLNKPSLFIVSRDEHEIDQLKTILTKNDWNNHPIKVYIFKRGMQ